MYLIDQQNNTIKSNLQKKSFSELGFKERQNLQKWIGRESKELNKEFFDELIKHKSDIETNFGKPLAWERLDDKKMSRLAYRNKELSIFEREDWDDMLDFFEKEMVLLEKVLRSVLKEVKQEINA